MACQLLIFKDTFVFGYDKEFTFVISQIVFNDLIKKIQSIFIYITQSIEDQRSCHWTSSQISTLILIVPWHYFIGVKQIFMIFTSSRIKLGRKV